VCTVKRPASTGARPSRHPVGGRERLEFQRRRGRAAGCGRNERAHGRFIGWGTEMDGEGPSSRGVLESRGRELLGGEALGEGIGDFAHGRGIAGEARDYSGAASWGRLGHQTPRPHPRYSPPLVHNRPPRDCGMVNSLFDDCPHHRLGSLARCGPFRRALRCLGSRFAQSCPQRRGLAARIGNQ
jgi:hypothetical protein